MAGEDRGRTRSWRIVSGLVLAGALVAVLVWFLGAGRGDGDRDGSDRGANRASSASSVSTASPTGNGREMASADAGASVARSSRARSAVEVASARAVLDTTSRHGVMTGRVVSAGSGAPIAAAEVSFALDQRTHSVRTDGAGCFRFEAPASGRYQLAIVTAEGFFPYAPAWRHSPVEFEARPGVRLDDVLLSLSPMNRFAGLVVDSRDRPVEGATVHLHFGSSESALLPAEAELRSDRDGAFAFTAVDDAIVEARHPEHGQARAVVDFGAQVSHRVVLRLVADSFPESDGTIAGRVVDAAGEPVVDVLVEARYQSDAPLGAEAGVHPSLAVATDPDGSFAIVGLDRGRYRLTAEEPGLLPVSVDGVATGTDDVELVIGRGGVLRLIVRSRAEGTPLPAFTMVIERPVGELERRTVLVTSVYDAAGQHAVFGMPSGNYVLSVNAAGFAAETDVGFVIDGDSNTPTVVDAELGVGGEVAGVVRSGPRGPPLGGARVTVEGQSGHFTAPVPLTTSSLTEEDGRFSLRGVEPGLRSITVSAVDHHGRIISGLSVREGSPLSLDIDLTPTEGDETPRLELAGIGVVIAARGDVMVVGRVLDGGGASEAGVVAGDAIVTVGGVPVSTLGFGGTIERLRGPEGSSVRMLVRRGGDGEELEMVIIRRRIRA